MTSNDAPRPGARAGRRRALGRGPGGRVAPPVPPLPEAPEAVPSGIEPPEPAVTQAAPSEERSETTASPAAPPTDATSPEMSRAATGPEAERALLDTGPRGEPEAPASPRPDAAVRPPAAAPEAPGAAYGPADRESVAQGVSEPGGAADGGEAAGAGSAAVAPVAPAGGGAERPPEAGETPHTLSEGAPDDGGDGVFKVRLANFEGPFDLLLQLISRHKMDVTEVALSKVTDEFMAHIRAMGPDWDLDETTEFLVVAATLLDLKAARLLPAAEVEDEADLALLEARDLLFARLLQYRAYKQIAEIFNERLEAEARRYPRTVGLEPHHAELLPEVVISIGPEGFAKLAVKAMQPKPKPQVYVEHIHAPLVSVQEQAGIVVARLKELGEASFRLLVEDTEDTLTVVARFLALLELYREKAVELDQETALGDLLVRWTGGDADTEPVVTDEFDRPPEKTEEERKA
ncbi:segregation and condensation protein A [Streptomyces sp. NPDC058812]|uniref:segregation and condensation protein A n=1 Tax=unclassified Streptomyces TaxID=2593676 RepID=UPI00369913D7